MKTTPWERYRRALYRTVATTVNPLRRWRTDKPVEVVPRPIPKVLDKRYTNVAFPELLAVKFGKDQYAFFTPNELDLARSIARNRGGLVLRHGAAGATIVPLTEPAPVLVDIPVAAVTLADLDEPAPVKVAPTYKELQARAKAAGLKATGSAAALAERLAEWEAAGRPQPVKTTRRKSVKKAEAALVG